MKNNLLESILYSLDSYKNLHSDQLPDGTEYAQSYFEARSGAQYDYTIFFGLQYILKRWLAGPVVTKEALDEFEPIMKEHFKFSGEVWSRAKWDYIIEKHGGRLPIRIRAVKEGTRVPVSNALFVIENTDPNCAWLTNALETVLQHVWYGMTVCTRSHFIVSIIKKYFKETVDDDKQWITSYEFHDFGQRACTTLEQAGIGGCAHLINSKGTDSVMGIKFALDYYGANIDGLAYSVPASEHGGMTALGEKGEFEVVKSLIKLYPKGILSVVSDSYSIENAVKMYCTELKDLILGRDGKFVVRPDSPRFKGDTPQDQVLWIVQQLDAGFGHSVNSKGFKVLDPHLGVIYGDGIDENDIRNILEILKINGYSSESCVFGCGGHLLQRLHRDTERVAIKCCAQYRHGQWHDIRKKPSDESKMSKAGRLSLVNYVRDEWNTLPQELVLPRDDKLELVFENGEIKRDQSFDEIRQLANLA